MATILASCPDCGDVEFLTQDIKVEVSNLDGSGNYLFRCPGCASIIVKSAETRTINLLLASGVEQVFPLTREDVECFAAILDDEEFFQAAISKLKRELRW